MEKKPEEILTEDWLKDVSREVSVKSFKADEMVKCPKCSRTSPPTRLKCMYCGADLPVTENHGEFLKPKSRKIEIWEKAFNLVYLPDEKLFDAEKLQEISETSGFETSELEKLFSSQVALPLMRVESAQEAEILHTRLEKFGLKTQIVADGNLKHETALRRLRRVEFEDDKLILILFNTDEIAEISREDLVLIVTGAIFDRKIESREKRKKGETKPVESTETSEDEFLVDLYTKQDAIGYRILANGFDYSSLESEKELFARDNILKLTEKLKLFAPEAKFVGNYLKIRDILGKVWEVEERKDSRGLQRKGLGGFNLEHATLINNTAQFTKFSRLQRQVL